MKFCNSRIKGLNKKYRNEYFGTDSICSNCWAPLFRHVTGPHNTELCSIQDLTRVKIMARFGSFVDHFYFERFQGESNVDYL